MLLLQVRLLFRLRTLQPKQKLWGHSPAGLFGYSLLLGGFAGGQAEYMRVPYADVGPIKVPDDLSDEHSGSVICAAPSYLTYRGIPETP